MARGRKKAVSEERTYKNPNGFGTVYEIKSGNRRKPFAARVTLGWKIVIVNGKPCKRQQKKIIGYAETYEKAVGLLTDYHRQEAAGMEILRSDASFDDVYNITIERRVQGKTESLRNVYKAAYKHLTPIAKLPLIDVKTGNMQKCIDDAFNNGRSYSTLSNMKMVCKMVFEYGLQNDIIEKDYSDYLKIQKTDKKIVRVPFTEYEISKLWNVNMCNVDTILILLYTGIRINELLKIKTTDVHLDERYFITGSKTDSGKNRIVPIALPILRIIKDRYDENSPYLIHAEGKKITTQSYRDNIWKPIMDKLEMDHLPHDCRHTFCSITDAAGMNRVAQQKIVGHKGKDVTENVYIHKNIKQLVDAIDAVWPNENVMPF